MNSKFNTNNDEAYILSIAEGMNADILGRGYMKLVRVFIKKIGRDYIEGFTMERYGYAINRGVYPKMILTKQKKKKGILVPFRDNEHVAVVCKHKISDLLTLEEAKLKMIEHIVTNFGDSEICYGGCDRY